MHKYFLAALLCAASVSASAERVTVLFKSGVSDADIVTFLADWGSVGVRPVAQTASHGVVVELPSDLSRADLKLDPTISRLL